MVYIFYRVSLIYPDSNEMLYNNTYNNYALSSCRNYIPYYIRDLGILVIIIPFFVIIMNFIYFVISNDITQFDVSLYKKLSWSFFVTVLCFICNYIVRVFFTYSLYCVCIFIIQKLIKDDIHKKID